MKVFISTVISWTIYCHNNIKIGILRVSLQAPRACNWTRSLTDYNYNTWPIKLSWWNTYKHSIMCVLYCSGLCADSNISGFGDSSANYPRCNFDNPYNIYIVQVLEELIRYNIVIMLSCISSCNYFIWQNYEPFTPSNS